MRLHMELEHVLSHRMPDGSEKPIGFVSRTLSKTEIKYPQIEKEGLLCVWSEEISLLSVWMSFHSNN